jgi:Glycosyl-transferase for dystroglycan
MGLRASTHKDCSPLFFALLLFCSRAACDVACIPGRSDPGVYTFETVKGGELQPYADDVTLVTQLTLSKANVLAKALTFWTSFSSVVFYVYDANEAGAARDFSCDKCTVTVVQGGTRKQAYPINMLRQIALEMARTELVFTLDTDFFPSAGIVDVIQQHLPRRLIGKVLVVPAFEFRVNYTGRAPRFTDMRGLLDGRKVAVFHSKFGGHKDTKSDLWLKSKNMYCLNTTKGSYEPYVIVNRTNAGFPSYNVAYVDRGMNKIMWIRALKRAKFRFCVLPEVFLIHTWELHPKHMPFKRKYGENENALATTSANKSSCATARVGRPQSPASATDYEDADYGMRPKTKLSKR